MLRAVIVELQGGTRSASRPGMPPKSAPMLTGRRRRSVSAKPSMGCARPGSTAAIAPAGLSKPPAQAARFAAAAPPAAQAAAGEREASPGPLAPQADGVT